MPFKKKFVDASLMFKYYLFYFNHNHIQPFPPNTIIVSDSFQQNQFFIIKEKSCTVQFIIKEKNMNSIIVNVETYCQF